MSILLPEIDDAAASNRLHSLQSSLKDLEIRLGELSTWRHRLDQTRADLQQSSDPAPRRRSLPTLQSITRKGEGIHDDLRSINEQLQDIDSKISNMLQRHRRLSFSVEIYKEILAPISRVPYELLQQIFLHSLPPGFVRPSSRDSPLLLTAVCRKWRSVAFSTPLLWSSLSTTSDWPLQIFRPHVTPSLPRLFLRRPSSILPSQPTLWIERAGQAPFHMEITIPKKDLWFGSSDPFLHWVVLTSERWFHLRLTARPMNLALLLSKPMPKLKILELVGIYDRSYDMFMLRTYRAEFDLFPERFSLPWPSLTTLDAPETWFIVDQLLVLIKGSPNLQSCTVKIQDLYTSHQLPYCVKFQITHSSLTLLHIIVSMNDRESYALRRFLDSTSLTSLKTFHVSTLMSLARSDWPHSAFIGFVQRSDCPLQKLNVKGFSMLSRRDARWLDPARMTEIWSHLPLLETFEFL